MKHPQDDSQRTSISVRATGIATLLMLLALGLLCPPTWSQETQEKKYPDLVYVAGSGNAALDQHVRQLLQDSLGPGTSLVPLPSNRAALVGDAPVVALGPTAFSNLRQFNRRASVLAMFVERSFIQAYTERHPGQVSAVYYDVPLLRQALIGKAILPQATRISLLATQESIGLYDTLITQLPAYGLEARVFVVETEQQLIPTLARALSYGDFLLAAPDDAIYNPRTIKHILLTAYRRNKIVIGPSQAYVKAGSLASGYSSFPTLIHGVAHYLDTYFKTGAFPAPDYPEAYGVEINRQVAHNLLKKK